MDISINVTAHAEGIYLYRTFRSIVAQIKYAKELNSDIKLELNLLADDPTDTTLRVIEAIKKDYSKKVNLNIFFKKSGDISLNRNFLIDKSNGNYVVFFDGDDLFSENYIHECFANAVKDNDENIIYTTENFITFQKYNLIWRKVDHYSPNFSNAMVVDENPFPSLVFARKNLFKRHAYTALGGRGSGYGAEDWHWFSVAINAGCKVKKVENTLYCYRVKISNSLLDEHQSEKAITKPSPLFLPSNFIEHSQDTIHVLEHRINNKNNNNHNAINARTRPNPSAAVRMVYDKSTPVTIRNYISDLIVANKRFIKGLITIKSNLLNKRLVTSEKEDLYKEIIVDQKEVFYINFKEVFDNRNKFDIFWGQIIKLNRFEPLITTTDIHLKMRKYDLFEEYNFLPAYCYYELCKYVISNGVNFKHIVFVPWVVIGGSDNFVVRTVNHLARDGDVLLVCTDKFYNDRHHEFLEKVHIYNFEDLFTTNQPAHNIDRFFIRLIQHFGFKSFTSINSLYANNLIKHYGSQLGDCLDKRVVFRWSLPLDRHGNVYEWPADFSYDSLGKIDYIVSDNNKTYRDIKKINPLQNKIVVLDMPIEKHSSFVGELRGFRKRILVAGRIAKWDKMIEETLEIAKNKKMEDIEFDFRGPLDDYFSHNNLFIKSIKNYKNINYLGQYKGFSNIDVRDYDLILFASRSEGMPNVILEAIGANLFVISSAVGGVPDVIEDGINGYLINDELDTQLYVDAIKKFYKNFNQDMFSKQLKLNNSIIKKRTEFNFELGLDELYN